MIVYRCLDCRPTWTTNDPKEARKHAARFDCLIHPNPGRERQTPPPPDTGPDPDQLALDI